MSASPWLIPNVAAEEGSAPRSPDAQRAIDAIVGLWRMLFSSQARPLGSPDSERSPWPDALGAAPTHPVFPWLRNSGAVAWINTRDAARAARETDTALGGPDPAAVERVHDKAFAAQVAEREGLVPRVLRGTHAVFDAQTLRDGDAALQQLDNAIAAWPSALKGRFALKPRIGTSGRGRVDGRDGRVDTPAVRAALPRLAERGGAILEPWLSRERDFSVQLHVDADGALTLLGTLVLCVSPSGIYRGHRGVLDYKGRVVSGEDWDADLIEAATLLAQAAHAEGFFGPCGLDAFTFALDDRIALRPVVEFNARFTAGTVVLGLIRRAVAHAGLARAPGERRPFYFGLDAPPGGWPDDADGIICLRLGAPNSSPCPGLVVAADEVGFEAWLARSPVEGA